MGKGVMFRTGLGKSRNAILGTSRYRNFFRDCQPPTEDYATLGRNTVALSAESLVGTVPEKSTYAQVWTSVSFKGGALPASPMLAKSRS